MTKPVRITLIILGTIASISAGILAFGMFVNHACTGHWL
jgi:hypothetical protein